MSTRINWRHDIDEALADGGSRDLPVILDFFKPTCRRL